MFHQHNLFILTLVISVFILSAFFLLHLLALAFPSFFSSFCPFYLDKPQHIHVRGQLVGTRLLTFHHMDLWGPAYHQVWLQTPCPAEPSQWCTLPLFLGRKLDQYFALMLLWSLLRVSTCMPMLCLYIPWLIIHLIRTNSLHVDEYTLNNRQCLCVKQCNSEILESCGNKINTALFKYRDHKHPLVIF